MNPPGKYRIGAFKPFVPDWARFCTLLVSALVFQLSGAVYLSNLTEIVGTTGLTAEDIRLIADASFCGTTIMFPILFRLKFRFMSRTILLTAGAVLIAGNLITMNTTCMPVLLVTAFIIGVFTIAGIFECLTSMQLVVTPKRDLSVFFCFVFAIVLGTIQLSGLLAAWIGKHHGWQHMHLAVAGTLAFMVFLHASLLRPFRFMKRLPLYGIDWLSMALGSAVMLLVCFVAEYGRRLDWLESDRIRAALAAALALSAWFAHRMFTVKRPLIPASVFSYRNFLISLPLYVGMQFLLGPGNVITPAFTGGVLKYSILDSVSLNWAALAGVIAGSGISLHWLAFRRGGFKPVVILGFAFLLLSNLLLHRLYAPSVPMESMYLPYVLRGAGQAILFIALNIYMTSQVPFHLSMCCVCLFGVIRTANGAAIANACCNQLLEHLYKAHRMVLGQELDLVNPAASAMHQGTMLRVASHGHSIETANIAATSALYGRVQVQAMLASWKDMLACSTLLGLVLIAGILAWPQVQSGMRTFPSLRRIAADVNPVPRLRKGLRKLRKPRPEATLATEPLPEPASAGNPNTN